MGEDAVSHETTVTAVTAVSAAGEDGSTLVRTTLTSIDPRSAAKIGAAVGVCLFVAWMIAAVLVYILLGAAGVWDRVNSLAGDLLGADGVSAGMYFGVAAGVGVLEVIVAALLVPLGAVLYNAVAGYVGGLRLTLGEGAVVTVEDAAGTEDAAEAAVAVETDVDSGQDSGQDNGGGGGAAAVGWGGGAHRA